VGLGAKRVRTVILGLWLKDRDEGFSANRARRKVRIVQENRPIKHMADWFARAATAQHGRLFLWAPIWLGVGIVAYFAQTQEPALWIAGLLATAGVLSLAVGTRFPVARLALVPLACAAFGFAAAQVETAGKPPLIDLPRRSVLIEGDVRAVDLLPGGGRRLSLGAVQIAGGAPIKRLARITMEPDDPVTPDVGDHVRTRALLANPEPPSWPGARDPQFEAYFANLAGSGRALALVEDLGGGKGAGFIAGLRQTIAARAVAALPGSEGEIAATLMAGATAAIPQSDRAAFAASGLAHILAVAGLHMAIVMGVVFGAVRLGLVLVPRWGLTLPCKEIAAGAGLLAGFVYLLLTGDHVPTERSFAMASLVVLGIIAGRQVLTLRGLALAAMIILIVAPDALVGVSFQMSFAAVLALIVGYRTMERWLTPLQGLAGAWGWTARHFAMLCVTSFLAGTATLPFAAASFGQIQIYYVLANLVAVPITVVVVMPMVVLALILMPIGASYPAFWVMGKGIWVILWVARLVASLPAAVVPWPPTPVWGVLAVAAGITLLGLIVGRPRLIGLVPLAVGLAAPFIVARPDFLIARDGRAVAWRDPGAVELWQSKSGAKLELEDWQRVWPRTAWQAMPACTAGICRLMSNQVTVVSRAASVDCTAKLILSVVPLRNACPLVLSVDRLDLWQNGAYEGWWRGGKVLLISDRSARGVRPWVPLATQTALVAEPRALSE